jgi:hypothetical protein
LNLAYEGLLLGMQIEDRRDSKPKLTLDHMDPTIFAPK